MNASDLLAAAAAAAGPAAPPLSWKSELELQGVRVDAIATLAGPRTFRWDLTGAVTLEVTPRGASMARGPARLPVLPDDEARLGLWTWLRGPAPFAEAEPLGDRVAEVDGLLRVRVRGTGDTAVALDFEAGSLRWVGASYQAILGDRTVRFEERLGAHAPLGEGGPRVAHERTLHGDGVLLARERVAGPAAPAGGEGKPKEETFEIVDVPARRVATHVLEGDPRTRENDIGRAAETLMTSMRAGGLETLWLPALTHLWHVARTRFYSSPLGLFELTFLHEYAGGVLSARSRAELGVPCWPLRPGENPMAETRPPQTRAVLYVRDEVSTSLGRFDSLRRWLEGEGWQVAGPPGVTLLVDRFYRDAMVTERPVQALHWPVVQK